MKKTKNKNTYQSSFSLKLYALCQRLPFLRYLKVILYFTDFFLLIFIKKPKYKEEKKKKVFIMFNYAFGDGVIWLNSAKELRNIYTKDKYEITLICQKGINSLYENENIFDKVLSYNLTKATFDIKTRFNLYKLLRKEYYDIVIDPIGVYECTTNVFMSRALCAKKKITILDETMKDRMCPLWMSNKIYDEIAKVTKPNLSLIDFYYEMIRYLGNSKTETKYYPLSDVKLSIKLPKEFVIFFPSASTQLKRWPIKRYAEVAHRFYNKTKLPIVLCGTKDDLNSLNEFKEMIKDIPSVDIIGKTSLLEFIQVVKKASYVITNDTSTYHIAVVNQIPVAIITGGYTYDRYVTYNFKNSNKYKKPYVIVKKMKCFNCDNKCKKLNGNDTTWPCLNAITTEDAWKVINKMIEDNKEK